jgi:hypothetical protein
MSDQWVRESDEYNDSLFTPKYSNEELEGIYNTEIYPAAMKMLESVDGVADVEALVVEDYEYHVTLSNLFTGMKFDTLMALRKLYVRVAVRLASADLGYNQEMFDEFVEEA